MSMLFSCPLTTGTSAALLKVPSSTWEEGVVGGRGKL